MICKVKVRYVYTSSLAYVCIGLLELQKVVIVPHLADGKDIDHSQIPNRYSI